MKRFAEIATDLAGVAGAVLIGFGAWCMYEPAGYVVGGMLLLAGAVLLSRSS